MMTTAKTRERERHPQPTRWTDGKGRKRTSIPFGARTQEDSPPSPSDHLFRYSVVVAGCCWSGARSVVDQPPQKKSATDRTPDLLTPPYITAATLPMPPHRAILILDLNNKLGGDPSRLVTLLSS